MKIKYNYEGKFIRRRFVGNLGYFWVGREENPGKCRMVSEKHIFIDFHFVIFP